MVWWMIDPRALSDVVKEGTIWADGESGCSGHRADPHRRP